MFMLLTLPHPIISSSLVRDHQLTNRFEKSFQMSLVECLDDILEVDYASGGGLVNQQNVGQSRSKMSLIHYHSMARSDMGAKKSSRCNAHTDSGQITLLFQDDVGELEVCDRRSPCGQSLFVPVPPVQGAIIVQVGDMLEKQSNGRWRSALHRVTVPTPTTREEIDRSAVVVDTLKDRYSIAFFLYPDFKTRIEALPECKIKGPWNSMDWGSVQTAGQWWRERIRLEFGGHVSKAETT